jgi:hypothetical protein
MSTSSTGVRTLQANGRDNQTGIQGKATAQIIPLQADHSVYKQERVTLVVLWYTNARPLMRSRRLAKLA